MARCRHETKVDLALPFGPCSKMSRLVRPAEQSSTAGDRRRPAPLPGPSGCRGPVPRTIEELPARQRTAGPAHGGVP